MINKSILPKNKETINIVMSTDHNYQIMYVAIQSILINASNETSFKFHILTEGDFSGEVKRELEELTAQNEIVFYDVSGYFIGVKTHLKGITTPTYYRLLISKILENETKALYLDTDVVVLNDLSELYSIELGNNLVAGSLVYAYPSPDSSVQKEYMKKTGLSSLDSYINAGVLLMNLDEMRSVKFVERSFELVNDDLPCQDQDIINLLCMNRILVIPFKYNLLNVYYDWNRHQYQKENIDEELREAYQNPTIIHYANWYMKPWNSPRVPYAEIWWTICRNGKMFDYFWRELEDVCFYYLFYKRDIPNPGTMRRDIWDLLRGAGKIVVYGAGKVAKEIVAEIRFHGLRIDYIMTTRKTAEFFEEIPVVSVNDNNFEPNNTYFVIAANELNTIEIINELQSRGYYRIIPLVEEKIERYR